MHPLIGIHAALGEIGALAFLWVLVELISPTESRVRRATTVAFIGILFLVLAWVVGGYYYITDYGALVKPVIKAGPFSWAHSVITETKEHVFLFLPFLSIAVWGALKHYGSEIVHNRKLSIAILILAGLIVLLAFSMAGGGGFFFYSG